MQIWNVWKKSPPKPGDFQNKCQIEPKTQIIFVMVNSVYPISGLCLVALLALVRRFCFTISKLIRRWVAKWVCYIGFPTDLIANLRFMGMRLELDSGFPWKLDWFNICSLLNEDSFFEIKFFLPCGGVCAEWLITPWALVLEVWGSSLSFRVVSLDKELCLSSPRCINGYRRHTAVGLNLEMD